MEPRSALKPLSRLLAKLIIRRDSLPSVPDIAGLLGTLAYTYGYLGVFVASLAGSVIPFLPVPYLLIIVLLSGRLDPVLLGVVADVGGAAGKTPSYLLGGGRR